MTIVNTSGWSITKEITLQSKNMLIQNLIYDEVIGKRERYIRALRRGLTHLGVLDMLLSNQEKTSQLFLHQVCSLQLLKMYSCIINCPTVTPRVNNDREHRTMHILAVYTLYKLFKEGGATGEESACIHCMRICEQKWHMPCYSWSCSCTKLIIIHYCRLHS